MNSSTGFKKRSLLRPPSGQLSNQRQFLKVVDISQSQPILASNIRNQVAAIHERINLIDKDKKIRTSESSLQKGYILSIKKWLKDLQSPLEKEDDDRKILKFMGVDNHEDGFKKLWKILTHLDLIVSKTTELQVISFLKYDELFNEMTEDSEYSIKILEKIAKGGFNPCNFHISQLLLDRNQQVYSTVSELRRQGSTQNSSRGFTKSSKDQTNELIEQLRVQNQKLVSLLEQFQQNSKRQKQAQKNKVQTKTTVKKQQPQQMSGSPETLFTQIQNKYKQQLQNMQNKIDKLNNQLSQLKSHCGSVETRLKVAEQELKDYQNTGKGPKPDKGSYQQALLEEMNKMKSGFERRIQRIMDEYKNKEKEMRKKEFEYKAENDRVKWEKGLLMKKFEAISA